MNCRECRQWIDDLLLRDPDEAPPPDVVDHLSGCEACARGHALALKTLEAITPRAAAVASPRLKERILAAIPESAFEDDTAVAVQVVPGRLTSRRRRNAIRTVLAIAMAAAVLLAVTLFPFGDGILVSPKGDAFSLLAQAAAAEARLFAADDIVALVSEIIVDPIADPTLGGGRWLPLISIGADGKPRFHQLKLGTEPGEQGYTIRDESWYDPATRRFAHVLTLKGRPLFANAYDGRSIRLLELDEQGRPRMKDEPVTPAFEPPKDPGHFLGIIGVALSSSSKDDFGRPDLVRDEGPIQLADGSPARALRVTFSERDADIGIDAYSRVFIRDESHRVESLEFFISGKKVYTIRRGEAAGPREPRYGWDLAGLRPAVEQDEAGPKLPVRTLADMIRLDVSPDDMAKRADFPVYIFNGNPGWTTRRQIVDMFDVASPPHRMFAAVYPAKDKRHVVLLQAHTFNAEVGPLVRKSQLLYTSPAGFKVWSNKNDKSLARILLSSIGSTRIIFSDRPAEDCSGYLLETPEGTYPALAVNGVLTDAELHGLVDRLERVRPK
jgi:hypothetical protein